MAAPRAATYWLPAEGGYTHDCADECVVVRGLAPCHCVLNPCAADPEAQTCSTPGAICSVIAATSYDELECRPASR